MRDGIGSEGDRQTEDGRERREGKRETGKNCSRRGTSWSHRARWRDRAYPEHDPPAAYLLKACRSGSRSPDSGMSTIGSMDPAGGARRKGVEWLNELRGIDWIWIHHNGKLKCDQCGREFKSLSVHGIHEPCVRQSPCYRPLSGDRPDGHPFHCLSCPFTSGTVDELCYHRYLNHRDKAYRCNHCGHATEYKGEMFTHLREVHYSHRCPHPDSGCIFFLFDSRTELIDHLQSHHRLPVMECTTCGQVMVQSRDNFTRHSAVCTPLLPLET